MTEREFANIFTFAKGFEASTLKIPSSGQNGGSAAKIKQIIGFAKFRTRAEALEARDALNGRKIDAERGCVLKTEMAKKNLHTKQPTTGFSRPRSRHDSVGARSASIGNLSSPTSPLSSPSSRSFSIDTNPPGNTLFVGNLPQSSSAGALAAQLEERLRSAFSVKPGYRQLSFRVKVGGPMCFVEFDSVQSAGQSLAELNGDTLGGAVRNGGLRLSFSKNPLFRSTLPGAAGISSGNIGSSGDRSPASPPLGHGQLSLAQASATLVSCR
ncbi:hypothetical protein IE81DRAFT_288439 [Ceraceosorus guamensis]|uniref:RRM domain-containing protein n=1 Tax=Ceraceosorus guamensis TaxID=1522189 RepID=A0A316W213_9BASI|nr:hypothetical protein IE81DRAFT_288439 [Ceraceosorus guamensis]PWN43564.1 hypothetical protein IE81DRAFT_288439 [Ceraceosorus guamensis]